MKKWWQQMNRGVLLLFVAVLAVSIYLIFDGAEKKKDKAELEEISAQFISDSSLYFTYPSDETFWKTEEALSEDDFADLMSVQAQSLSSYFCENEAVRDTQLKYYYMFYATSRENRLCPVVCSRIPLKIDVQEIYNDSATVVISTQTTIEFIDEEDSRKNDVVTSDDTLLFLKLEGEWKLVSAQSEIINNLY